MIFLITARCEGDNDRRKNIGLLRKLVLFALGPDRKTPEFFFCKKYFSAENGTVIFDFFGVKRKILIQRNNSNLHRLIAFDTSFVSVG